MAETQPEPSHSTADARSEAAPAADAQSPHAPVAAVRSAHRRFVEAVSNLSPAELAAPTALAGWTRGHVIAHVADGGRAFADLTESALLGELVPSSPAA